MNPEVRGVHRSASHVSTGLSWKFVDQCYMVFGLFLRSPQLSCEKRKTKNSSIGQVHPGKESLERPNSTRSKLLIRWRGIGRRWTITYENVPDIESVAASARKSDSVNLEKKTFLESGDSHEKLQSSSGDQKEH